MRLLQAGMSFLILVAILERSQMLQGPTGSEVLAGDLSRADLWQVTGQNGQTACMHDPFKIRSSRSSKM